MIVAISFLSELFSMIYTRLMEAFYMCFSIRAMDFSGLRRWDAVLYYLFYQSYFQWFIPDWWGCYMFSIRAVYFSGLHRWDSVFILSFLSDLLSMIYIRLMGLLYVFLSELWILVVCVNETSYFILSDFLLCIFN